MSDFGLKREPILGVVDCEDMFMPVNDEVVELLEGLLKEAKEGQIKQLGVAVVRDVDISTTVYCGSPKSHSLVAAVQRLAHRIQVALDDDC